MHDWRHHGITLENFSWVWWRTAETPSRGEQGCLWWCDMENNWRDSWRLIELSEDEFESHETKNILTKRSYRIGFLGVGAPKFKLGAFNKIGSKPKRLEHWKYKVGSLEDRGRSLEDQSPQETKLEPEPDIGLEPLRLVPQNWQGWSLGDSRSVSSPWVGTLHILYLIYWRN